jgi:PASTA domain
MLGLGKASADLPRSTSTSVSCPAVRLIGQPGTCTARVTNTDTGSATTPTGIVELSATGIHGFAERASCALSAGSCQVTCPGDLLGLQTIAAVYEGDSGHAGSSNTVKVLISVPIGPGPCCFVPRVKGESLSQAKRTLRRVGFGVGKIDRAFSTLVAKGRVISERPGAGKLVSRRYTKIAGQFESLRRAKVALLVSKGKPHARP